MRRRGAPERRNPACHGGVIDCSKNKARRIAVVEHAVRLARCRIGGGLESNKGHVLGRSATHLDEGLGVVGVDVDEEVTS